MQMPNVVGFFSFFFLYLPFSHGAFANHNSILIGDRAAGMGGAFTAMTGDAAASPYYNPATLVHMNGSTITASISTFNKFETQFGDDGDFERAPMRLHQGAVIPIPNSSGYAINMGNFAMGLSVLIPDYDTFNGEIPQSQTQSVTLRLKDQSLWMGGSIAARFRPDHSLGLSMYFASRSFSHSLSRVEVTGNLGSSLTEERVTANNSLVYITGYHWKINSNWSLGVSYRWPSIPIAGRGSYSYSEVDSVDDEASQISRSDVRSESRVPQKLSLGVAWEIPEKIAIALDVSVYGREDYLELPLESGAYRIRNEMIANVNLGIEYRVQSWLSLRGGVFTNLASSPEISDSPQEVTEDHIDMLGVSGNLAVYTSPNSTLTLGGFYTGGRGYSVQKIGPDLVKVLKTRQLFTFLVGSTFHF